MKKIIFLVIFFLIFTKSFSQEKDYSNIFENCDKQTSINLCIMEVISKEVQSEYERYRIDVSKKYDLQQVKIKYTITKKGLMIIESIDGNIDDFKPKIIEIFKKFPKVQPVIENGKTRNAQMTTSFYLFPKKK